MLKQSLTASALVITAFGAFAQAPTTPVVATTTAAPLQTLAPSKTPVAWKMAKMHRTGVDFQALPPTLTTIGS